MDAPTEPTELNTEEGMEYIPTPTVLPRIMLMAEKVPSLPLEDGKSNCGVWGMKLWVSFVGETSVVLDEAPSSECLFEE
jgi:hypothetical protein